MINAKQDSGENSTWLGDSNNTNSQLNYQIITALLLSNPLVEDCYLLAREGELIAYIVYSQNRYPEQLSSFLQSKLSDNLLPNIYVGISCLPLTATGHVDEIALKNIEITDSSLAQYTENKLKYEPEIEQVAVVVTSKTEKSSPLHLSELLPLKKRETVTEKNQQFEEKIHQLSQSSSSQLAISHGKPLIESELQAKTLAEALLKSAQDYQNQGIVYIKYNGNQVFQTYFQLWDEAQRINTGLKKLGLQIQDKVIFQLSENCDIIPAFWGCILGGFIPVIISVPPTYKDFNNEINKICQVWELLEKPLIITNEARQQEVKTLEKWLSNQTLNVGYTFPPVETLHATSLQGGLSLKISCIEQLKTHAPAQTYHINQPDDLAFFNLTSGSTGISKCVALTHKNLLSRARGTNLLCEYNNEDIVLNWLPFDHIGSISDWHIRCVDLGCQMIYVQTEYILGRPLNWLDLINQYRITHSWAPNFAYNLINEALEKEPSQTWNLDSIKFFLAAGESVSNQAVGEFIEKLHRHYNLKKTAVRPAFGMAEMGSGITYYQPTDEQPLLFHTIDKSSLNQSLKRVHSEHPNATTFTDLGLPISGISIRIVNQENHLLPEKTIGHLQVKGESVSPGYYKNPKANQEAFLEDGWFKTGDLGFISHGHLIITGRSKETIIINGVNYYSHEIETVVETIEGVEASYTAACAVKELGNNQDQLGIFFSTETFDKNDLADLLKKIRQKVINSFGVNPKYLIPLNKSEIPKTSIGKIQRSQLIKRFETGEFKPVIQEVDIILENANTIPDWFYRKVWKAKYPVNIKSAFGENYTLIFLDKLGLGEFLTEQLTAKNLPYITVLSADNFSKLSSDRYTIKPGETEHYRLLMESLAEQKITISNVLHLLTYQEYEGEIASIEQLEKAQEQGIYSLLFLVQALAKIQDVEKTVELIFVSSYSQLVDPKDDIAYQKSPVLGIIKTLAQENPWLNSRHLDLPVNNSEVNGAYILQELLVLSREREIAYRRGIRLITGLEKVNLSQQTKQELPFKPGGIYLISGGLGGIGIEVAQYLLKNYQARLLLIGKTSLPEKSRWNEYLQKEDKYALKIKNLQALEQLGGEVIYQAVDVANLTQLQQAVEQVKVQWQGELDGVIHLAGIYQENLLINETKQSLAETLRPKVLGTWILHQLLKETQGIFISFSSLASFFGGATIGGYAAANSFLEHLNDYQKSQNLFPSYCYSWTTWQETGISKGYQMKYLTQAQGYYDMTVQQGLDSFLAGLYHNQEQLIIGLEGSNPKIRRFTSRSEGLQKLTAYYTSKHPAKSINLVANLLLKDRFGTPYNCELRRRQSLPLNDKGEIDRELLLNELQRQENREWIAPRNEAENKMAQIWQNVLNLSKISINDNFFELGGHSLLASQVISRLRDIFSVELSLQSLLEYPTIASLTQTIEVLNVVRNNQISITETQEDYEQGEL